MAPSLRVNRSSRSLSPLAVVLQAPRWSEMASDCELCSGAPKDRPNMRILPSGIVQYGVLDRAIVVVFALALVLVLVLVFVPGLILVIVKV